MNQSKVLTFLAVILFVGLSVLAGVPQLINFQGQLKNNSGGPLVNDTLAVEFKIYDAATGGNVKWSEVDTVITDANGLFTILLGKKTPIPDSVFNDSLRWLGIKVGSDAEISPRSQLSTVGYSYVSSQWTSSGQDLYRLNGNVGIGTSNPGAKLNVETSFGNGILSYSYDPSGTGVYGFGATIGVNGWSTIGTGVAGNSGFTGVWGEGFGSSSSGIYGTRGYCNNYSSTGEAYGVYGQGIADQGFAYGGYFVGSSASVLGTGVYAQGNYWGVYASGGTNGVEAYGNSLGLYGSGGIEGVYATGGSYGVDGYSPSGTGVRGVSSSGAGVVASGGTNGVEATGGSRGVYAIGNNYGVVGSSSSGTGVYGSGLYGVYGVATQGFQGYGVYGSDGDILGTWAAWFNGSVGVSEFLSVDGYIYKNGGGFRIDHPLDPANKYLYHSFVESPDMTNLYNGNVTLNAKGEATVGLPDWFEALNKDFRYQLTAIGAPGPNLYIADEISGNQFKIAGGTAGMKVSWQVTGIRKDAYAEAHRIPVEVEKTGKERGKYLQPEAHGMPASPGMHYEQEQKMAADLKQMEEERKRQEEQRVKMEQERKNLEEQRIRTDQEHPLPKQ